MVSAGLSELRAAWRSLLFAVKRQTRGDAEAVQLKPTPIEVEKVVNVHQNWARGTVYL